MPRTWVRSFPTAFWVLVAATFIDRLGRSLLFPFFALYVTARFGVGLREVAFLFAIFSLSSLVGNLLGGALTDRLGRRRMVLLGLSVGAVTSVWLSTVDRLTVFYVVALLVGLFGDLGLPAQRAIVPDLLPPAKHAEGYGVIQVAMGASVVLGPILGGVVATRSFVPLFWLDALSSIVTALIVYWALPETGKAVAQSETSLARVLGQYSDILKHSTYMFFLVVSMLTVMMDVQLRSSLPIYLRDGYGISTQGYGYLLSLNALLIVVFQVAATRFTARFAPLLVMGLGSLFYVVGYTLFGLVGQYFAFVVAIVIITIGDILVLPTGQGMVAQFAPPHMRGRYIAMYSLAWTIPYALGPLFAGFITERFPPAWLWYAVGAVGLLTVLGYNGLHFLRSAAPAAAAPSHDEGFLGATPQESNI